MHEDTLEEHTMKFQRRKNMFIPETPISRLDEAFSVTMVDTLQVERIDLPTSSSQTAKLEEKAAKAVKQKANVASVPSRPVSKRDQVNAYLFQERCRHMCLSIFFQEQTTVQSLGFTSAVNGEGKSFLATVSASALANDSNAPITLLECNWEHPSVHETFRIAPTPGLAEWLRGEVSESAIRHQLGNNLTVIPAGNGQRNAVRLVQQIRQNNALRKLRHSDELLIVDLPSIVTTAYGSLMAGLVDALIIVVRAKVTPESLIAETCAQLKDMPVQGVLLNQVETNIPHWVRQIL